MEKLIELWEKPAAEEKYLVAGWYQWADAGATSSSLPQYLIEQTEAKQIGRIKPYGFYLFHLPGAHHFLRPEIKLEDGHRKALASRQNDFFYTGNNRKGLVIFLGQEPHVNIEQYVEVFFDAVEELGVKRVVTLGGVYGAVPYDKERQISSTYSLPHLKAELSEYAIQFSNYEGGASIGSYLADEAERRGIEYITFYAYVPAYDFSELLPNLQVVMIENDFKAWYDVMRRLNHMFKLGLDLSDLARQSEELMVDMAKKFETMERETPDLDLREYFEQLTRDFSEVLFTPLDEVWERELGDLLDDLDEKS